MEETGKGPANRSPLALALAVMAALLATSAVAGSNKRRVAWARTSGR